MTYENDDGERWGMQDEDKQINIHATPACSVLKGSDHGVHEFQAKARIGTDLMNIETVLQQVKELRLGIPRPCRILPARQPQHSS